jgi:hypothetical protein
MYPGPQLRILVSLPSSLHILINDLVLGTSLNIFNTGLSARSMIRDLTFTLGGAFCFGFIVSSVLVVVAFESEIDGSVGVVVVVW